MNRPMTDVPRGAGPARQGRSATTLATAVLTLVLTCVWSWWAAKEGAYFAVVLLPGLVLLCGSLLLISLPSVYPKRLGLPLAAKLALGGFLGLALWSALSATWSPAPDVAVADAQRIAGYALAFGLGIWLRRLAQQRLYLAMVPLAVAGWFAGSLTIAMLLTGEDFSTYADEGTLVFPLGYRNANAAFFLIAFFPALHLAASRNLDWWLRALALGSATLCLELAMLSQSRGSTVAAAVALAVLLIASPDRARIMGWLALAILPALLVISAITDLHATAEVLSFEGTTELRKAGRAALGGALLALVLAAAAAALGRRVEPRPARSRRADRAVAIGAIAVALAGFAAFAVATGNPVGWLEDRVDEFLTQGTPEAESSASRFEVNAGSERDDLWRVALDAAGDDPLIGLGGGGYEYAYPRERSEEGPESVKDAHSVELEVLSELGGVGLALLGLALSAAGLGAWMGRRESPHAAALSACALAAGSYWLVHASLDWFWTYPAVTAPLFALLGAACLSASGRESPGSSGWRRALALSLMALALTAVPPYLAQRYLTSAYDGWRADPARAQSDLDRARALNPLAIEPLLAEGAIADAAGRPDAAVAAFREATEKRPEEWAAHYFLAHALIELEPAEARNAADLALALNPLSSQVRELDRRLRKHEDAAP